VVAVVVDILDQGALEVLALQIQHYVRVNQVKAQELAAALVVIMSSVLKLLPVAVAVAQDCWVLLFL
jgi:hypothetical protein